MRGMHRKLAVLLLALGLFAAACSDTGGDVAEETDAPDTGAATEADTGTDTGTETPADTGTEETPTEGDTPAETGTEGAGGEFSIQSGEPEFLHPAQDAESEGIQILQSLFTGLVDYDAETSEPVNAMAESIETEDSQTFTITIQDGWTFHNGEPITAQTYVDSWNYVMDPAAANANSGFFTDIEGTDESGLAEGGAPGLAVVDDTTFTVALKEPFSAWPLRLGYPAFFPMPAEAASDPDGYNENPIGNGPYMMSEPWAHDQYVRVERFPDYTGEDAGNADSVEFRIYSEINTAYTDMQAGNLDILQGVPPEQAQAAETEFGDAFLRTESSTFTYIGFPLYQEQWQNVDLRRAISLAIDRQAITDAILTNSRPAERIIPPVVPGHREELCEFCGYDPERAAQLYEAAGGVQEPLVLWFNSGAGHELWMEAVANQLRQNLGIQQIEFQSQEFAEYLGIGDQNGYTGPFRLGWGMDYPSPQNYLQPLFFTEADSNRGRYSNPEFEALVLEGNAAEDQEEAVSLYQQAEDILLDELPVVPLFFRDSFTVHSENVTNVIVDTFERVRISEVQVVQ